MEVHHAYNWRGGVTPGNKGSSLITGHAYARGSSQFNRFADVKVGNLVRITTPGSEVLTFKVTSVNRNAPHILSERLQAELRSHFGPARIRFYTCNAKTYKNGNYQDGIVITARLMTSKHKQ